MNVGNINQFITKFSVEDENFGFHVHLVASGAHRANTFVRLAIGVSNWEFFLSSKRLKLYIRPMEVFYDQAV